MGKHKFDRKKAVRFTLVPGPEKDGKPTVLFQPANNARSTLSKKQKKQVISQFADIDQITINGKVVGEDEIPAYVLEQIKGRGDLVFNQINEMPKEEEVGDMYEIQDGVEDDAEFQEYEDYDFEAEGIKEEQKQEQGGSEEEWEDQDSDAEEIQITEEDEKPIPKEFKAKIEQFPSLGQLHTINVEGKQYQLTKQQLAMLDTVIPENYEGMDFGGLKFKKYNEQGLLYSEKEKYEKYLLGENQKVVVLDTFHAPLKPKDFFDSDLKPSQITGNVNILEVEQALNYEGEEQIYEQLEDDFFMKMIQGQLESAGQPKKQMKETVDKKKYIKSQPKQPKLQIEQKMPSRQMSQKELQQKLQKAMHNFQHNLEEKHQKKLEEDSEDSQQQDEEEKGEKNSLNYRQLQKKQEYVGKDGEMDWRLLTKQQKKNYMKTKVIKEFYDELRERQIEQKMRGKQNVDPEELHLKQQVKHIPYSEDHVMQKALEEDLKEKNEEDDDEDYSSVSDDDDIVSFHQKTSIIATNLSVIEQPLKKKKKEKKEEQIQQEQEPNISKIKVVPEKRNRDQTSQQRKQRKARLKQMKKQKKQQKKQFAERFCKAKKEMMKKQVTSNPLNKVSYIKIY